MLQKEKCKCGNSGLMYLLLLKLFIFLWYSFVDIVFNNLPVILIFKSLQIFILFQKYFVTLESQAWPQWISSVFEPLSSVATCTKHKDLKPFTSLASL